MAVIGILIGVNPLASRPTPKRRLEDRIRELSRCIASAMDYDLEPVLSELRAATAEYKQREGNRRSATILSWPEGPRERRRVA